MSSNDWFARIREGLVRDPDAPHYKKMGNALWVYLILHMGADLETGQLFRTFKTISNESGIPEATVRKMIKKLEIGEYIKTVRMPRGLHIQITKWCPPGEKRVSTSGRSKTRESVQNRTRECPKQNTVSKSGHSPNGQNNGSKPSRVSTSGRSNETHIQDPKIYTVFNFWNDQKITVHREPEKFKSCINARLKYYTAEELCRAIKNYADILNSPDHFFSYRWSLSDFLTRKNGLDQFIIRRVAFANFRKNGAAAIPLEPPPETEQERAAKKLEFEEAWVKSPAGKFEKELEEAAR